MTDNIYILYLLKSTICFGIGYIFHRIITRNYTSLNTSRHILLGVLIVSILLPLNNISITLPIKTNIQNNYQETQNTYNEILKLDNEINTAVSAPITDEVKKEIDYFKLITLIYLIVSGTLFCLIITSVISAFQQIRSGKLIKKHGHIRILYNTNSKKSFSFFQYIVINPSNKEESEIEQIISHEMAHAEQLHSFDLILISFATSLFWFNPFVWLLKRSFTEVHEFLADKNVLDKGIEVKKYQKLLLSIITEERWLDLSSSFNHSQIKKRLVMMTRKSTQQSKLRIIWAIPMIALVFTQGNRI